MEEPPFGEPAILQVNALMIHSQTLFLDSTVDILVQETSCRISTDLAIKVAVGHRKMADVTFFEHDLVMNS